jgi:hypothetical protein
MQVTVPKRVWTQITSSDAKLHVKVPYFTKMYYVERNEDPNTTYPDPKDSDEIKILVSPNHAASFLNIDYVSSGNGPLFPIQVVQP